MHAFEKHLMNRGYTPQNGNNYSTIGDVCCVYKKGKREVVFGLGERGFPPTLIHPLPFIKIQGYEACDYCPTIIINRVLATEDHSVILKALFDKSIVFNIMTIIQN